MEKKNTAGSTIASQFAADTFAEAREELNNIAN